MRQLRRVLFYLIGQIILAVGLTLSTKVNLGVSPILSIAYCASVITGRAIGDTSLIVYIICIIAEIILHARQDMQPEQRKKVFIMDLLQLPLSLVFTRVMNLFARFIPTPSGTLFLRIPLLILAIVCVGVGAAMTLDMRLIANPADGIVQVISDVSGLKLGLTKNIVDISCVILTAIASFILVHRIIGIHVGTLLAMFGTGRVIAVFNRIMGKHVKWLMNTDS